MAYLWHYGNEETWTPIELTRCAILRNGEVEAVDHPQPPADQAAVLLHAHRLENQSTQWILLAAPGFRVYLNGEKLDTGIRILADRDAIYLPPYSAVYFSTERRVLVEEYSSPEQAFCPRCKLEIKPHDLAVCCPRCLVFHHHREQDGESCWTYTETCALCDQPTELNSTAFNWTPGEL